MTTRAPFSLQGLPTQPGYVFAPLTPAPAATGPRGTLVSPSPMAGVIPGRPAIPVGVVLAPPSSMAPTLPGLPRGGPVSNMAATMAGGFAPPRAKRRKKSFIVGYKLHGQNHNTTVHAHSASSAVSQIKKLLPQATHVVAELLASHVSTSAKPISKKAKKGKGKKRSAKKAAPKSAAKPKSKKRKAKKAKASATASATASKPKKSHKRKAAKKTASPASSKPKTKRRKAKKATRTAKPHSKKAPKSGTRRKSAAKAA